MRKGLLLLLLISVVFSSVKAQWVKCNLPASALPFSLAASAENIYLGTLSSGMFLSTDKGSSWKEINTGITNKQIWSISIVDNTLFAGTSNGGLFRSTDNGSSWTSANNGISATTIIKSIVKFNSKLFATSTNKGIYISADNGNSWTQHNTGITGLVAQPLLVTETDLYAGVLQSVYKYDKTNEKWISANSGIINNTISSLVYLKDKSGITNLFAGISNSGSNVYRSVNSGASWTGAFKGLPSVPIATLATVGTTVFAGNDYGVYISKDMGDNWTDASSGFTLASYATFLSVGKQELYVIQGGSVWRRNFSDFGITSARIHTPEAQFEARLMQNYPNPVSGQTTISYSLLKAAPVVLTISNLSGSVVKTVVNEFQESGNYDYLVSISDSQLLSGMYLVKLIAGNSVQTCKMIVVQ